MLNKQVAVNILCEAYTNIIKVQCWLPCPFGEGCHFLHYVPDGYNVVARMRSKLGKPIAPPIDDDDDNPARGSYGCSIRASSRVGW
ncbi:hypothetical protein JHK86_024851 [Glycine max]|nr:hypothetical protein JHK86_024851 [Glycine max]